MNKKMMHAQSAMMRCLGDMRRLCERVDRMGRKS